MCSKLNECSICTNNMTDNFTVVCPFCNVEICESCFQYGITMELQNPICIYCKKNLSLEFVLANNVTEWCKKTFVPYFENLCLEKEKSLLTSTIDKYKNMVKVRDFRKQIRALPSNKKLENQLVKVFKMTDTNFEKKNNNDFQTLLDQQIEEKNILKNSLESEIDKLENNKDKKNKKKETVYISNCLVKNCRGFINNKYTCEICDTKICKACMNMMIIDEDHVCNRNDIESAELIKNSSKPCPKCYVPIFKISGCNQMFCTNCHVVFDWVTLKIDTGSVHNAHYFDWMTSQRNDTKNINLEEIACGDINNIFRDLTFKIRSEEGYFSEDDYYYRYGNLRRIFETNRIFHGEIIEKIRNKNIKNNFEKYRIQYLDKQLSIKSWKSKIAKDTINNEKYNSVIEVLEMYIAVTSDFIRQIAFKKLKIRDSLKKYKEFYQHFYESIDDILEIFGGSLDNRMWEVIDKAKVNLSN